VERRGKGDVVAIEHGGDEGANVSFAAPFNSGVDLLTTFGLSGGMPTLVSLHRPRLGDALRALRVDAATVDTVLRDYAR
ncbi:MAG: hypothetical protein AAGA56_24765, partial [Myxococcota bacterium]